MLATYCESDEKSLKNRTNADPVQQVDEGSLYFRMDFDSDVCDQLHEMCHSKMIYEYLTGPMGGAYPVIVRNSVLEI